MKKVICTVIALVFIFSSGCKNDKGKSSESALAKKYAKYQVLVYKDKDLKQRLALLAKAEDVSLLAEEKYPDARGKTKEISKIKLADDSVGYIEPKHLADLPIVFTADTKAFVRPTTGSSIYAEIPKGELGFIIGEKGLWVQVYIGKINDKYITQQWVEGGYSNDPNLVLEAKQYSRAVGALNEKDQGKAEEAKATLEELAASASIIAELARNKLGIKRENFSDEESADDAENTEGNIHKE